VLYELRLLWLALLAVMSRAEKGAGRAVVTSSLSVERDEDEDA
jgi:hypothetical protein